MPLGAMSKTHDTVLLHEAIEALGIKPGGIYVDGTFGRGGHSRLILEKLGNAGRLIALDRDPEAIKAAAAIQDPRFCVVHGSFAQLSNVLRELGEAKVDGVLLDLGVSSPQLDDALRGFSFRHDSALDMRMDTSRGMTAAEWLNTVSESELGEIIRDYGEERFAKQIARALVTARATRPVTTTQQLAQIVATAVRTREPGKNPATRTFQAIRIHINQELEEITAVLPQCEAALRPGGRMVVISFHSLEDRIVKHFMQDAERGEKLPRNLPVRAKDMPQGTLRIIGRAVRAAEAEVAANPRARSAIMRVAERTEFACV
jgi:16S rRNA (cytosine1402-N4)-methyltransferase